MRRSSRDRQTCRSLVRRNTFQGGCDGPVVRARRELPLPGDACSADARVRADRARPVDDARAVLVRHAARRHRVPRARRPRLHPQAAPGPARPRPPGLGPGPAVRHRAARAPARAADAGSVRRAHRAGRPPRRAAARPLASALGDVGHRGLHVRGRARPGRDLPEDAPRDRRRRLRREPDLAPVQPRAGRRAHRCHPGEEGLAARARPGRAAGPRGGHHAGSGRSRPSGCWPRR